MNDGLFPAMQPRLRRYGWILAVVWTGIVAASTAWNVSQVWETTLEEARAQARGAYEKDLIYRRWSAAYGGVYVPVSEGTEPNPYLAGIPERDITTPSGRELTLVNPAYMTRQVHELAEDVYGVRGHITSLDPIRPENAADVWEIEALVSFEQGETEISGIEQMDNGEYMRLMRPLVTEASCLKCHAVQGYQEGDIRGGISVSIPMNPLRFSARRSVMSLSIGHGVLWLVGLVGTALAVQSLKRSEEELAATNTRLEEATQHKSQFLTNMSHELRTPLNSIIGFSEVLVDETLGELNEKQRGYQQHILTAGRHLLSLICDILDLSKVEAGKMELDPSRCDPIRVIQDSLVLIEEQAARHSLHIDLHVDERLRDLSLHADERKLKQILFNLLSNATKYTLDGGSITVDAKRGEDEIVIRVQDTGIGIATEDLERVFEEFEQIDSGYAKTQQGTGLGLALTKRLVGLHGGHIWVESEGEGKGSTFTFTIPIRQEEGNIEEKTGENGE